jgi:hypothetical protein
MVFGRRYSKAAGIIVVHLPSRLLDALTRNHMHEVAITARTRERVLFEFPNDAL